MILQELRRVGVGIKMGQKDVFIRCPFHSDGTPSLGISVDPNNRVPLGTFQCFGCGEKGNWNKLAKKLGMKLMDIQTIKDSQFNIDLPNVLEDDNTMEKYIMQYGNGIGLRWEKSIKWRGISGTVLDRLGAYQIYDNQLNQLRVILPISIGGEIKACIRAALEKDKKSYVNSAGNWGKKWGLFPFDLTAEMAQEKGYCCITEGPRDALRLVQLGIPAIAILGAQNWGPMKRRLLEGLGCKLYLMMDGDRAGEEATRMIKRDFYTNGTKISAIKLSKLSQELGKAVDPGNLPKEHLLKLKRKLESNL